MELRNQKSEKYQTEYLASLNGHQPGHSPLALYLLLLPSWDSKIKILHSKNIEISVKYSNLEICSFSENGQKHAHNTKNGLDGFQIMLYIHIFSISGADKEPF